MSRRVFAAFGPVLPDLREGFFQDAAEMTRGAGVPAVGGVVFLDPQDGLRPLTLVPELLCDAPGTEVLVPLVCRDANRTALLGEARSAEAVGVRGALLLAGHLDPRNPARTVYDLDPLQLLRFLREHGVGLELWAAGRCETEAERARLAALGAEGASCCVVPWEPGEPSPESLGFPAILWVEHAHWSQGLLPEGEASLLLQVDPGCGPSARELALRLQGDR